LGSQIILRAIDKDQNGVLDQVVVGDISLDEANKIYQLGLDLASTNKI
jgi:hypothetical protein